MANRTMKVFRLIPLLVLFLLGCLSCVYILLCGYKINGHCLLFHRISQPAQTAGKCNEPRLAASAGTLFMVAMATGKQYVQYQSVTAVIW